MLNNTLIERLEALTAPCREVDRAIHNLIDPERFAYFNNEFAKGVAKLMGMGGDVWEARKMALYDHSYSSPLYTASIDAAMTLAGDNWRPVLDIATFWQGQKYYDASKLADLPRFICLSALHAREATNA